MFNNMLDIFISAQRANPFTFIKIDEGRNLRMPLKKLKQEFSTAKYTVGFFQNQTLLGFAMRI